MAFDWPSHKPEVLQTPGGIYYLKEPGVALVAQTISDFGAWNSDFLSGFDPSLGFDSWGDDETPLSPSAELIKAAGQLCYLSFGAKRTWNHDIEKYVENILSSGHGSLLEHASFSFLIWGASRSYTHEQVRHRAGWGYSQVSQRYVHGATLRFVERIEFQDDPFLHLRFMDRIERAKREYDEIAEYLMMKQKLVFGASKTELRKKVNQVAREALPNETEAPILITSNLRGWRHFMAMRGSGAADTQIRRLTIQIYRFLFQVVPEFLQDIEVVQSELHGEVLQLAHPKV